MIFFKSKALEANYEAGRAQVLLQNRGFLAF